MKKHNKPTIDPAILRKKAEELLKQKPLKPSSPLSEFEALKLFHELEVHKIELEMQNEELLLKANAAELAAEKYSELYKFAPSGYFTLSREGEILELNQRMAIMLGKERSRLLKSRFVFFVSEDSKPAFNLFVGNVFSGKAMETCELTIVIKDNLPMHVHLSGTTDETGEQCFMTAIDISELKQAEEKSKISEEHFHSLFNNMTEGVALHELVFKDGKPVNYSIIDINNPYLKILGMSREQIVGKLATEAYGTPNPPYFEEYARVGISKTPLDFETYFAPLDKHFAISVVPWQGKGFATIFSDISDRKKAEEEIKLKNEVLQKVNAEKDKFFSIIAHDLRSPLSTFIGITQMIAEELPSMELADLQELSLVMEKSASNLFRLLENLLEWAKMQRGLIPFNPEVVQLDSSVNESVEMLVESIKNKGIEIESDISDDIKVMADANMLQTVIRNLVSNAVKFTPKGGKVSLSAKASGNNSIEIAIRDTGIGMSPDILYNLFQLDAQTNRKGTDDEPSSGLGLLLCKEFIEKHGGRIWVESEEGKGSIFYFTLPCPAEMNAKIVSASIDTDDKKENEVKSLKILIAEDDELSGRLISIIVKIMGNHVINVRTGVEAVQACRQNPELDLVLMDVRMPEMNGYEAVQQIRKFNSDVVIIAQTAYIQTGEREKALEAGCNDYITKPIQREKLIAMIQKYFKK